MRQLGGRACLVLLLLLLGFGFAAAQPTQNQQELPDAPTPNKQTPPQTTTPPPTPPPQPLPNATDTTPTQPPPTNQIKTVPPGGEDKDQINTRDQIYTLSKTVNFVQVPVIVKDDNGHLVDGLQPKDFSVYEDGVKQDLTYFTSDPFPLSAAVVIDVGMPDITLKKINQTMPALAGAFGQLDEIAVYTYGNTVSHDVEYTKVTDQLGTTLRRLNKKGRNSGAPVVGGPFNAGPSVNGQPVPGTPAVHIPPPESNVLNDAILAAAQDLTKRDRARRKVIFVISDGKEHGSRASYSDVLRMLLSQNIMVYGIATDASGLPVIGPAERADIRGSSLSWKPPFVKVNLSNILGKYAYATGGEVMPEFSQDAIERAYSRLMDEARNQYTLGYNAKSASPGYRPIEVRVHRGGLFVHAKDGYFPLPPARGNQSTP
jgi:VWFA-related protein